MNFETLLLVVAKVGLGLLALAVLCRFILIPFLWYKYDKPIEKLIDEFEYFKQEHRKDASGRGITQPILDRQIAREEERIMERVKVLQLKRQHFLDRINLFLTMSSLGK